jgi:beta-lactam-binding protein with PASTA domain
MSLIAFLRSRTFLKNILLLLILGVISFFVIQFWLASYTHHGENIPVPDLRGQKIAKLDAMLNEHDFHYTIVDSFYDPEKAAGTVLDQDPAAKSKVKEGRMIYITINATTPPDVKMPDLVDVSFRQAEAILQSYGLMTGEIIYKPDLAKNAVLEQRYKDKNIKAGTLIPKGSAIDLVLGDGLSENQISVPDLTGLTINEARAMLNHASLSIGTINYEDNDSVNARIYRQSPEAGDDSYLPAGGNVDVYLQ